MKFIAGFWRLLVGIKDALVLLLLLLFFAGVSAGLSASKGRKVGEGALLLDLEGTIVEQPSPQDPVAALTGRQIAREHRLSDVLRALDVAQRDERVKAVVLDLDGFLGAGQVALESVGGALDRVKKSGKPVLAYATGYSDDSYVLAAHASEVWLNPMGGIAFSGPGGSRLYFKGLLDRLGVNAHVYRVGAFKSAVEPFIRTDQSPEARQANEQLAGALWTGWQEEIRHARPKARIADAVANPSGSGDLARAALDYGLVDKLADRETFEARVAKVAGEDAKKPGGYRSIALDDWIGANPLRSGGAAIGVVTVAGDIIDGEAQSGTAGAETIVRAIRQGFEKHDLKALIVRIDSPGGSALASERIRLALLDAKRRGLPVIVSMGSVAASGGYWVATAGDRIFAEPTTITGSIGVFGVLPTFENSLAKIGLSADGVRTTPLSGQPDLFGGTSPEFDRLAQTGIESTYARFLNLVSQSRRLPVARVNEIAQGRVWDGGTARQIGLVDAFGSFNEALAEAAKRAKLDPEKTSLVFLEREPSWFEKLAADFGRPSDDSEEQAGARDLLAIAGARQQALIWTAIDDARRLATGASIQARCLECATALPPRTPALGSLTDWLLSKVKG